MNTKTRTYDMGMGNLGDKIMNRFFRKIDGVTWDLMTGRVGVQVEDGIASLDGEGDDAEITISVFDQFGMPVPAFAQNTPPESVTAGDLIYYNGKIKGWVLSINRGLDVTTKGDNDEEVVTPGTIKSFGILTPTGTSANWKPPKVNMFGFDSGVMVARSLLNMLPGGKSDLNSMSSFLPMMMAFSGGNMDMDSLMPMMLFSQLGASGTGEGAMGLNNPMMPMMMMAMMNGNNSNMFSGGNNSGMDFFNNKNRR